MIVKKLTQAQETCEFLPDVVDVVFVVGNHQLKHAVQHLPCLLLTSPGEGRYDTHILGRVESQLSDGGLVRIQKNTAAAKRKNCPT